MRFVVAGPEHEPSLRAMMRRAEMPGWVRLSYEHEPDFLRSISACGRGAQAVAALEGDELVGCGYRSWWRAMVNGEARSIGYIGGLRSLDRVRGGMGLARGYRCLRQLHGDGMAPAYLTTIVEENRSAIELLTSSRVGLPAYRPLGRFLTRAVLCNRWRRRRERPFELSTAAELGWDRVAEFLSEAGRRRNFGPCPRGEDLAELVHFGLDPESFVVASSSGRHRACAALWEVESFRQKVVRGYGSVVGPVRPLLNVVLAGLGFRALPRVGDRLKLPFAAFVASIDDDPEPLGAIFEFFHRLCESSAATGFVVGFHESDPLAKALSGFTALTYASLLYLVHWDDGLAFANCLDRRLVPYLEAALL